MCLGWRYTISSVNFDNRALELLVVVPRFQCYFNFIIFQVSLSLWDTSEACGADYRDEQVNFVETLDDCFCRDC